MAQPNENRDNNNMDDVKDRKIFVGGLCWSTTTEGLKAFFEQFGGVLDANVVLEPYPTRRSKGYGFVTFRDAESAGRALENPKPVIDGRTTDVNLAYLRAKSNNKNNIQPNQNGLLHQPGQSHQNGFVTHARPSHPFQNGFVHQGGPSHQYPNGPVNQVFPQHYLPATLYPNAPPIPFYSNPYGGHPIPHCMYNGPYSYHMGYNQQNISTNERQQNWENMTIAPEVNNYLRPNSLFHEVSETNQEVFYVDVTDTETGPDSDVSGQHQEADDQEVEITSGQSNGFEQNVEDLEVESLVQQFDDNYLDGAYQSGGEAEGEAEDTTQANGFDHEGNGEYTSQEMMVLIRKQKDKIA